MPLQQQTKAPGNNPPFQAYCLISGNSGNSGNSGKEYVKTNITKKKKHYG